MFKSVFGVALVCATVPAWAAQPQRNESQNEFLLGDRNSEAFFRLDESGQVDWRVDGVEQLFRQTFFFRSGGMQDERELTTLDILGAVATDTNPFVDDRDDALSVRYLERELGLTFDVSYALRGGTDGTGFSDLAEQIVITNSGNVGRSVYFFQYVDFDLGGTTGGDTARIVDGRVAQQFDVTGNLSVSETVVTPAPAHFQVGNFADLLDLFSDGSPTTLNDNAGPFVGDAAWAFEWHVFLDPGETFIISKDKIIFPSPSAAALLGMGGLLATRRRRS